MNFEAARKFIAEDNKEIEGWFFTLDQVAFLELFLVQDQMRVVGDVAEIGVYQGKSLVLLSLLKGLDERLLGFDLFDADYQDITQANLAKYGSEERVVLVKGLTSEISTDALDNLLPSPLRFLHVDAGHEYHEVLEQLHLFSPYVSDSGVIAMDDYQDREFPGIEAAVLEFAEVDRPRRFVPFLASGNKLFMCLSSVANMFQQTLLNRPNFRDSCRLSRVKDFNILIMRSKLPVSSQNIIAQLNSLDFPKRSDTEISLNKKSSLYSQISFGAGE